MMTLLKLAKRLERKAGKGGREVHMRVEYSGWSSKHGHEDFLADAHLTLKGRASKSPGASLADGQKPHPPEEVRDKAPGLPAHFPHE